MKVKVLTIHSILNYGSVLQAYALNKFLRDKGLDAELIDYRPNYRQSLLSSAQGLAAKALFLVPYSITRGKFDDFIRRHIKATKVYDRRNLYANPPQSDAFIVGSDQVWNRAYPYGQDGAFYLDFVKQGKKIAYAASIGQSNIPADEVESLKQTIRDFDSVSFREKSAKERLEEAGVPNTSHVFDPIFLLDRTEYSKIAVSPRKNRYLLVYTVEYIPLLEKAARHIADRLGLEVVSIGGLRRKVGFGTFDRCAGPEDFLSYIQGASFVLTSSFHCTAFSTMMNKNLGVVLPPKSPERLNDFLRTTELTDCIISDERDFDRVIRGLDFSRANEEVKRFAELSGRFLLNALHAE